MPTVSDDLLGATIQYLEELKARGVRTVRVSPETLVGLTTPAPRVQVLQPASFAPPAPAPVPSLPAQSVRRDTPVLTGDARLQAMADLRARVMGCIKCAHLVSSRTNVVFGVGNVMPS